jgi:hypothetical protein
MRLYYPSINRIGRNHKIIKTTGKNGFMLKAEAMFMARRDAKELKSYGEKVTWFGVRRK